MPAAVRAATSGDVSALTGLLVDTVRDGASVGFLAELTRSDAQAFWRGHLADQAVRCLVAVVDGVVVGTVSLVLAQQPNGRHRAELVKLLVAPSAQRQGVARRLLAAAEEAARKARRTLLVLDTTTGSPAQALYAAEGWTEVGQVPDYAAGPDGALAPTTVMFKRL